MSDEIEAARQSMLRDTREKKAREEAQKGLDKEARLVNAPNPDPNPNPNANRVIPL